MMYAIFFMITALAGVQKGSVPTCDAALARLFVPRHPVAGHYETCRSPDSLETVQLKGWKIEVLPALDAFGGGGTFDRARVAKLYGGRRATVARGWIQEDGHIVSITLISPFPDATLTRLDPGTLIIRFIL